MKLRLCALVILVPLALAAKDKKPAGEISDRAAFAKIQSYCVDTSGLASDEAYLVNGFIETESQPKKLLSKLPWKLRTDCREANPDAIIKLEFPFLKSINIGLGETQRDTSALDPSALDPYKLKAVLQVSGADSARVIYKVQATPLDNPESSAEATNPPLPVLRRSATYNVFWTLIHDVELVSPGAKK